MGMPVRSVTMVWKLTSASMRPWRNLGLVGRVGGVPGGVFQDVAQDHAGRVGAVVALADEALEHLVFAGHGLELGQRRGFADHRRECPCPCCARWSAARCRRSGRGAKPRRSRLSMWASSAAAHADVAGDEFGGVFEFAQGVGGGHRHGVTVWQGQRNKGVGVRGSSSRGTLPPRAPRNRLRRAASAAPLRGSRAARQGWVSFKPRKRCKRFRPARRPPRQGLTA